LQDREKKELAGPLELTGIYSVAVQVRDLDRSLAFYRDLLGLRLQQREGELAHLHGYGGTAPSLVLLEVGGHATRVSRGPGLVRVAWRVDKQADLDVAEQRLKRNGLTCVRRRLIAPLIPRIVRPLGKKRAFIFFGLVGVAAGVGISLSPPSTIWLPIVFFAVMGISTAGVNTLMWALEADTVEYGEWRTGVRTEGITYALFSFTRKLGQAVGGALAAFIIGLGGYVGGVATQSQSAINAIRFASGFAPAIFIVIGIAIFFRYPLTEQVFAKMVAETAARRAERRAVPQEA
jgi:catechol 2,3-dioxygenase-like lactoylglutathione lyase family enzyme